MNHIFIPAARTRLQVYLDDPSLRMARTVNSCPCAPCKRRRRVTQAIDQAQQERTGVWDLVGHPLPDEWKP